MSKRSCQSGRKKTPFSESIPVRYILCNRITFVFILCYLLAISSEHTIYEFHAHNVPVITINVRKGEAGRRGGGQLLSRLQ